jgi:hypothetical protein
MPLVRCSVVGTLPSGREWSFRQYYTSSLPLATVAADWASHISGAWTIGASALQAFYPTGTVVVGTRAATIVVVPFATGPKLRESSIVTATATIPGTATGPALPDNNAIVVSRRTATPGPGGRGRNRLPAVETSLITANEVDAVTAAHISTAMNGLRTNMASSGHTAVLVVERPRKDLLPVGTTTPVTQEETDRVVRSARQRDKRQKAVYA